VAEHPTTAERLARAVHALPEAGATFLTFHLLAELGRGAFSRVFLARQAELGDRNVALKISVDLFDESHTLAQLQHTNIAPIYSAHSAGPLQAICMPYFGRTTLADVLGALQGRSVPESGAFLVSMLRGTVLPGEPAQIVAPAGAANAPLKRLEKLSYVQAVLWMTGRLAEGLAHAHERGIVHRDIKPANILISDDGQPMLLDFNLATDLKIRSKTRSQLGGTLPYMAPEHLDAFQGGTQPVDARSDIYSLGVILYEALTGRLPFAMESGPVTEVVPRLLARRPTEFVNVRHWNPAVTPAVESIVLRCLEFDPGQRYQTAGELAEDIHRHLDDLPLRYAPEPSLRERAGKWRRRHPRLTSPVMLLTAGFGCAALLILWTWVGRAREEVREVRKSKDEATAWSTLREARAIFPAAQKLEDDLILLQLHYGEGMPNSAALQEDLANARKLLNLYDVLRKDDWQQSPLFQALPEMHQNPLRETIAELLFWSARAHRYQAGLRAEPGRQELQRKAWQFNQAAEKSYAPELVPRGIIVQKADLAELLGKKSEAAAARARAERMPGEQVGEFFLAAYELAAQGKLQESIRMLRNHVLHTRPQHFWAQLLLAVCLHNLAEYGQRADYYEEAVGAYSTCLALRPDFVAGPLQRGWLHLRKPGAGAWKLARADADEVLKRLQELAVQSGVNGDIPATADRHADWASAHFLRARAIEQEVAEKCRGKPAEAVEVKVQDECKKLLKDEAIKDLTDALKMRPNDPAIIFFRASLYTAVGEEKPAAEDLARVLAGEPPDAEGWAFRGKARLIEVERLEDLARQSNVKKAAVAKSELAKLDRARLAGEALKDFARALAIDPRCLSALYQQGRVLAEFTDRSAEAVKVLTRTVDLYPDFLDARGERGLVSARRLERVGAYADAIACLDQDPSPQNYFQAARIFALTARELKRDRAPALKLLSFALRNGYGWERFENEPDFAAIRDDAEFQKLVEIAPLLGRGVPPRMRMPAKE